MANMTPEERQQFMDRMRARGVDPEAANMTAGRNGGGQGGGGRRDDAAPSAEAAPQGGDAAAGTAPQRRQRPAPAQPAQTQAARNASATTIDALFGPLPPTESFGQVWLFQEGKLSRVPLRLGISDGQQTELIQGDLKEGEDIVTSVTTAAQRAATTAGAAPGIFGNQGRGFPGGGFPGGGGGNRGGGAPRGGR
jgi:hypothetical protein